MKKLVKKEWTATQANVFLKANGINDKLKKEVVIRRARSAPSIKRLLTTKRMTLKP